MAKVSRPIVYTVVAAVGVYAVVLLTEPEKPPRRTTSRTASYGRAAVAPAGFTPEDMTARFARYKGSGRDAFRPGVVPDRAKRSAAAIVKAGDGRLLAKALPPLSGRGAWSLTGVSESDGVRTALIENPASGDSEFLTVGEEWNGLTVVAVEEDAVVFVNALGQRTRLTFAEAAEAGANAPTAAPAAPAAAPVAVVVPRGSASTGDGISVPPRGVRPVVPVFPPGVVPGRAAATLPAPSASSSPAPRPATPGPRIASRPPGDRPAGAAE